MNIENEPIIYVDLCSAMLSLTWWRHPMETFSALLAICAGNSSVAGEFPHKAQWRGALMFSLICVWINGWVNNSEACDLRHYRAHYDVIVMFILKWMFLIIFSATQCIMQGNHCSWIQYADQSQWDSLQWKLLWRYWKALSEKWMRL